MNVVYLQILMQLNKTKTHKCSQLQIVCDLIWLTLPSEPSLFFSVSMCMRETHILLQLWLEENAFLLLFSLILISFSPCSLLNISVSLSLSWRSRAAQSSLLCGAVFGIQTAQSHNDSSEPAFNDSLNNMIRFQL